MSANNQINDFLIDDDYNYYVIHNKNKISKSKQKPILQYDLNGNFIKEWSSSKQYALENNLINSSLCLFFPIFDAIQKSHSSSGISKSSHLG